MNQLNVHALTLGNTRYHSILIWPLTQLSVGLNTGIQQGKMFSHIFGTPVILPKGFPYFSHCPTHYPLPLITVQIMKKKIMILSIQNINFWEMCMILHAYRYILFIRYKISTHNVVSVSWTTVIKILERQLFEDFIYIFSDFIFEVQSSIWIKIYSYKVRSQKIRNEGTLL